MNDILSKDVAAAGMASSSKRGWVEWNPAGKEPIFLTESIFFKFEMIKAL